MIKRIVSGIFSDFYWKLLAGALAFLLWFVGTYMFNPTQNSSVNIALEHHNIEILANENLYLLNPDALVELIHVGVRAPRNDLDMLTAASAARQAQMIVPSVDFRAIDLAAIMAADGPQTVRLDVSVNLYTGFEHIFIRPSFIEVELDVITNQVFSVEPNVVGDVDSGLELRAIRLANNAVTVTGTRTNVARVEKVQVTVDIWGINYDAELPNLRLEVLDFAGNDITDYFQLSVTETTAIVPVWPIVTWPIEIVGVGYPAAGFAVEEIDIEPRQISVTGAATNLNAYDYILVEVDLDGRSESFVERIDLNDLLPTGVFLATDQESGVAAIVGIEPIIERVFSIPQDDIRVFGMGVIYDVITTGLNITVRVSGPSTQLDLMQAGDITLELDLRNRAIGVHTVTLMVDLPEGTILAQNPPTLQVQIHEPAVLDAEEDEPYDHYYWDGYDDDYDSYYEPQYEDGEYNEYDEDSMP